MCKKTVRQRLFDEWQRSRREAQKKLDEESSRVSTFLADAAEEQRSPDPNLWPESGYYRKDKKRF
jgi:hypothetical protein